MFLCTELMFQGAAVNLVAFGRYWNNDLGGQAFTIFLLVIAAAEVYNAPATPIDDNPHSIPVYGTNNPRAKAYPQT
jgi:hypothetical protein